MPLQQLPLQMCQLIPLAVTKGYLLKHIFGDAPADWKHMLHMCQKEDCIATFTVHGTEVALSLELVVWLSIFVLLLLAWIVDVMVRTAATRYRPRALWCCFTVFVAPFVATPFRMYVQFWAMYDFCWGSAKFICTERSSGTGALIPKAGMDPESLRKPLLEGGSSATVSTMAASGKSSAVSLCSMGSTDSVSSMM